MEIRVRVATALLGVLLLSAIAMPAAHSQTLTVLYSFSNPHNGGLPSAGVIRDPSGNLYGTTWLGGAYGWGTVFELTSLGKEKVLCSFTGKRDGGSPVITNLVRDSSGNLYGTTDGGGAHLNGTVFKVTPSGNEVVLYSFGAKANDGGFPGDLITDASGNFYGATAFGGSWGFGTVFEILTHGNETILYNFTGINGDGGEPDGGLVRDSAGNLYGTTYSGGYLNQGTIFKLEPNGAETILHTFLGGADGSYPYGLIADAAGNLYGTTGGASAGTVFKVDPSGTMTVLFTFDGTNGRYPSGRLTLDSIGNLYGTTSQGGSSPRGNVFKLDPAGNETVLYSFTGGKDGEYPNADPLVMDSAGNLYGATQQGGTFGHGVVFKLKP